MREVIKFINIYIFLMTTKLRPELLPKSDNEAKVAEVADIKTKFVFCCMLFQVQNVLGELLHFSEI